MSFRGSKRLRMRRSQVDQVRRANREWKSQDFTQVELRRRLDREARRAGFRQPVVLIKQAPKPPA